jgi:hypothetical protein
MIIATRAMTDARAQPLGENQIKATDQEAMLSRTAPMAR